MNIYESKILKYSLVDRVGVGVDKESDRPKAPRKPDGSYASPIDPETWSLYGEIEDSINFRVLTGFGIILGNGIVGVDLDKVVSDGVLKKAEVSEFIMEADTYCEVSPSGTGLHLIFCVDGLELPNSNKIKYEDGTGYEVYNGGRFFTVTENHFGEEKPIRIMEANEFLELMKILNYPWALPKEEVVDTGGETVLTDKQVIDLLARGKQGEKIKKLFVEGDISDYNNDHSSADMALINYIAFYSGNKEQTARLFLKSKLGKRDKAQKRADYVERSIEAVWSGMKEFYKGKKVEVEKVEQAQSENEVKSVELPIVSINKEVVVQNFFGDGSKKLPHFETGIDWFDEFSRGLQKTTILSAPSNAGKTMFALQVALNVSTRGVPVLYIDFEQGMENLYMRLLGMRSLYDAEDFIVRGKNLVETNHDFRQAMAELEYDMRNFGYTSLAGIKDFVDLSSMLKAYREQCEVEPLIIIDQIRGMSRLSSNPNMFEQTREIALWLESTPRNDDYTVLAISPQSKISDNDIEINSISGSSDLGYSVDSVINLTKVRKEKKDESPVGQASAMAGFNKYKKKEYEPWNKIDLRMIMTKSRTPRSKIEIALKIEKGKLEHRIEEKNNNNS